MDAKFKFKMHFESEFPKTAYPGQLICPLYRVSKENDKEVIYKFMSGPGTKYQAYAINGTTIDILTATSLGQVLIKEDKKLYDENDSELQKVENDKTVKTFVISIIRGCKNAENDKVNTDFINNLPKEGDLVLARVTRISLQRANVEILAVENKISPIDSGVGSGGAGTIGTNYTTYYISQTPTYIGETFKGIIRSQDVRATERDQVKIVDSFKPGDILRAQILSLGDGSNYYLTTARNDLGVVFAKALNGIGGMMYAIDWQTMISPSTNVVELRKCAKPF